MARVSMSCLKFIDKLPDKMENASSYSKVDDLVFKLKEECLKEKSEKTSHKRSGPLTPKQQAWQQKFKAAAAACKGKPGYRDCVGKQGSCEKVISVDECKFDRKDCTQFKKDTKIPEFEKEVKPQEQEVKSRCTCAHDNNVKILVDDTIKALIKFYNSL